MYSAWQGWWVIQLEAASLSSQKRKGRELLYTKSFLMSIFSESVLKIPIHLTIEQKHSCSHANFNLVFLSDVGYLGYKRLLGWCHSRPSVYALSACECSHATCPTSQPRYAHTFPWSLYSMFPSLCRLSLSMCLLVSTGSLWKTIVKPRATQWWLPESQLWALGNALHRRRHHFSISRPISLTRQQVSITLEINYLFLISSLSTYRRKKACKFC